jgi:hypothetical protein
VNFASEGLCESLVWQAKLSDLRAERSTRDEA